MNYCSKRSYPPLDMRRAAFPTVGLSAIEAAAHHSAPPPSFQRTACPVPDTGPESRSTSTRMRSRPVARATRTWRSEAGTAREPPPVPFVVSPPLPIMVSLSNHDRATRVPTRSSTRRGSRPPARRSWPRNLENRLPRAPQMAQVLTRRPSRRNRRCQVAGVACQYSAVEAVPVIPAHAGIHVYLGPRPTVRPPSNLASRSPSTRPGPA